MEIQSLWIRDFRCVEDARIDLPRDEVWLIGPNASGKTSLLEAVYVLLRGHTFLSTRHGPLVRIGADTASIGCRIRCDNDKSERLDCLINGRACHGRLNDEGIAYQSLPQSLGLVRFFGANAQELISGEPRIRRNFVDWNLLHVEPSYRSLSARYSRLLHQRNAALKTRGQPISVWDSDLADLSEQIAAHRERYLTQVATEIGLIGSRFFGDKTPTLTWRHGWAPETDMASALRQSADSDRRRGFTQCGAHRFSAALSIGSNRTSGSRGEQKLLAATFQMACETVYRRTGGRSSIWLVDDAFAELTQRNGALLIDELRTFGGQLFLTGLNEPTEPLIKRPPPSQVFHVEHGALLDRLPTPPSDHLQATFCDAPPVM